MAIPNVTLVIIYCNRDIPRLPNIHFKSFHSANEGFSHRAILILKYFYLVLWVITLAMQQRNTVQYTASLILLLHAMACLVFNTLFQKYEYSSCKSWVKKASKHHTPCTSTLVMFSLLHDCYNNRQNPSELHKNITETYAG